MSRKFRSSKRKGRLLIGVRPLPTMITLCNLLCGFGCIVLAMRADNPPVQFHDFGPADCLYAASLLVFAAMIFDVFDGQVARWTKNTSRFGMEMDSLADVVSFGVAPAVLVKASVDNIAMFPIPDRYVWLLLAVYVCCAALRLARYNVEAETGHRDFFFGLPSPAAAGCVAGLVLLITQDVQHHLPRWHPGAIRMSMTWLEGWREQCYELVLLGLPFVLLCLGILMVSRVHYLHMGDRLLAGRRSLMHLLLLVLLLVLVAMMHEVMLAVLFNGYVLFGIVNEIRYQLFPSTRPEGWVASAEEFLHHGQANRDGGKSDEEDEAAVTPSGGPS